MDRRLVGAALLAVVVLAGCSGGGGDATPTPETDAASPSPATVRTTDSGKMRPSLRILRGHVEALHEAGNFTVETAVNVTAERADYRVRTHTYVNLDSRALYQTAEFSGTKQGQFELYKPPDERVRYERRDTGAGVRFRERPFQKGAFANHTTLVDTYGSQTGVPAFQDRGVVTTRGGRRHRYVAGNASTVPERLEAVYARSGEVTAFGAKLFVDPETGVVTRQVLTLTVENDRGTIHFRIQTTYHDVGSTTVPTPDWIDEARNSTSPTG